MLSTNRLKLKGDSLSNFISGNAILEVMAGIGRHVNTYKDFKAKEIVLVDICGENLEVAKKNHPEIETN